MKQTKKASLTGLTSHNTNPVSNQNPRQLHQVLSYNHSNNASIAGLALAAWRWLAMNTTT